MRISDWSSDVCSSDLRKIDVLNSAEWLEVIERGFANHSKYSTGTLPTLTRDDPRLFDEQGNPLYDTDWQEEATRTALSHNHQFAVQTKADNSSFGAFINYANMQGRSEEHTSELQSLMRISYAVFCLNKK